ncbi:hypothetical protein SISSUDRAFT_265639 [Sistotremastrum suecicum HHB10207 ss-3]|uniref:Uncharacterized protein n=1 Tax=Sistotremastrum suecicum HHB10207 ss-3 TaxID=1314776 RepID=A0A166GFL3_9AGAM|nr:hypothetical protein SISSUDRAFT_265639 [Sistotremastrum suecicum HHB10207 ss-3]
MGGIIGILALCLLLWILGRRTRRNRRIPPSSPWLGPPFPSQPPPRLLPITISKYDRDRMSERPVVSAGAPGRVSEQNPTLRQEDEVRSLGARLLAFMRTQRHSSQSAWSQAPPAYPQP